MQARQHYLLPALREAINTHSLNAVIKITHLLEEESPNTLISEIPDLLSDAFLAGPAIAAHFIHYLKDKKPNALFDTNGTGERNAFCLAVKFTYNDLAKEILTIAEEMFSAKTYIKCFVPFADDFQNKPLHLAAKSANVEIIQLILENNIIPKDAAYIIDLKNKRFETALHCAVTGESLESIALLINHGANLFELNAKRVTPLYLLTQLSFEKQLAVFTMLNPKRKQELIEIYEKQLSSSHYPDANPALKETYLRLAGLKSLQSLIIARHEYSDMPIRNTYNKVRSQNKKPSIELPVMKKEVLIEESILNLMPRYQAKLERTIQQLKMKSDPNNNNHSVSIDLSEVKTLPVDPESLDKLIQDAKSDKSRIMNLPARYPYRFAKYLAFGVMFYTMITFVAFLLVKLQNEESYSVEYKQSKEFNQTTIFFIISTIFNFFVGMVNAFLLINISKMQGRISKREYSELVKNIRETITNEINLFIAATNDEELKNVYRNFLVELNKSLKLLGKNQHQRNIPPIFKDLINTLELLADEIKDQPSVSSTRATLFTYNKQKQITQSPKNNFQHDAVKIVLFESDDEHKAETVNDSKETPRNNQILTIPTGHLDDEESSDNDFGKEEEEIPLLRMHRK